MTMDTLVVRGVQVGAPAPDVVLRTLQDTPLSLAELWQRQPTILFFLRHLGCGVCTGHLTTLRQQNPRVTAAGVQIVTILPTIPSIAAPFVGRYRLPFLALADSTLHAYHAYGLMKPVDRLDGDHYGRLLPRVLHPPASGHQGAVYAIDTDGLIRYRAVHDFVHPYPSVDEQLHALRMR